MAGETLKPEIAELFRNYRESLRGVFVDEIRAFIRAANCTRAELDAIYRAAVTRARELRASTSHKSGRPRGRIRLAESTRSGAAGSELGRFLDSGPPRPLHGDDPEFERVWARDRREHGLFRDVCRSCGDFPANRPLLLEQICLFVEGADQRELRSIREPVAKRRKTVKQSRRGRPDVRTDEELMGRARQVVWMRLIDQRSDEEIANTLGMSLVEPVRNASGWIEVPGNLDSVKRQLRRLEDYLAAAIWRAIPSSYMRVTGTTREIAPGALDHKPLQTYIRLNTGLPFRTHPDECKRIVQVLWPHGSVADWELFERGFSYRQKKR